MIKIPNSCDGFLLSTMTAFGKDAPIPLGFKPSNGLMKFEAILTATPGQSASVRCRPLAAESQGTAGFPVGGEVSISGVADANGMVGTDGFPFWSTFGRYGFEAMSITGTGASVQMKVA